jgi:hypothetical protein
MVWTRRRLLALVFASGAVVASAAVASCAKPVEPVLEAMPATATLYRGQSAQLNVTRHYPDGPFEVVTGRVLYTSSNGNVATVTDGGLVVAGAQAGPVVIHVADPDSDAFLDLSFAVQPAPFTNPTLQAIVVTPNPGVVAVGATLQFAATGIFSDGTSSDLTGVVGWSTSVPAAATVGVKGLATGVARGDATITASLATASSPSDAGAGASPPPDAGSAPDAGADAGADAGVRDAGSARDASDASDAGSSAVPPPASNVLSGSAALHVQ